MVFSSSVKPLISKHFKLGFCVVVVDFAVVVILVVGLTVVGKPLSPPSERIPARAP